MIAPLPHPAPAAGRRIGALALAVALLAGAAGAWPASGTYALGTADLLWAPLSAGVGVYGLLRYRDMKPVDTASLDRNRDLWAIDRWAAGIRSPAAGLASDALVYPMAAAPMGLAAFASLSERQGWNETFAEAAIYSEAFAFSSGLDLWVRSLRVHPRPLVYDKGAPASERLTGEASGSFYSGHANAAFLSATYFAYTWSLRHPGDESDGWVWAGALSAATVAAGLRVAAGKHYLSDVLVGAASGAGFGWLFPWLHRRSETGGKGLGMGLGREAHPVITWRF